MFLSWQSLKTTVMRKRRANCYAWCRADQWFWSIGSTYLPDFLYDVSVLWFVIYWLTEKRLWKNFVWRILKFTLFLLPVSGKRYQTATWNLVPPMREFRKYSAVVLLMLFSCYYSGISLFSHTHIVHGSSVVHSHLGGGTEHDHSDSQYAVIDILSNFQSECATSFHCIGTPFIQLSESYIGYEAPAYKDGENQAYSLRGPPQA